MIDEIAALLGLTNAHLFHEPIADDKEREVKIVQTRRMAGAIILESMVKTENFEFSIGGFTICIVGARLYSKQAKK